MRDGFVRWAAVLVAAAACSSPRHPAGPRPAPAGMAAEPAGDKLAPPTRSLASAEPRASHPKEPDRAQLDDAELARLLAADPAALGSLSLGKPNGGALVGGVQMPAGELWEVVDPSRAWGTRETIDYLIRAVERVHQQLPGGHPLYVGHISREGGGPLRPHRSHQSGRDVDISYFYKPDMNPGWYQVASERTLDLPRTWALIRALITETDVEHIFVTTPVQRVLKRYALAHGEDPDWLDQVFQYRSRHPEPIVRHAWGHATHMHVRFFNPRAQSLGARAFEHLAEHDIITPGRHYARYRVREGEGIREVARRFGTTPDAIRRMNVLKTHHLKPGRIYAIPSRGYVKQVARVEVPARRLPPPATGGEVRTARAR